MKQRRGGFVLGLVAGLLIGLALALGVAMYITRAPVPFINKVPQRTTEQDNAEAARNRTWNPNAPLGTRPAGRAAAASAGGIVTGEAFPPGSPPVPAPAAAPAVAAQPPKGAQAIPAATPPAAPASGRAAPTSARTPAAILSGAPPAAASAPARSTATGPDPFVYYVQAGAFTRTEEAEQQKAKLALMGHIAAISEREQAGRTIHRVRLGPMRTRDEADSLQVRLQSAGVETQIVRVEKP